MRRSDLTGAVIGGRYRIVERIADGAMGVVYRGTRIELERAVAIKVMHEALPGAMQGKKRFAREAKLMARLEHPHCVSIIDFGHHGTKPYVVMELVRGRDVHEMLVEQGRFEIARAAEIMRQVLSGLAHAHEQGIVHRDVKPANVMVTPKAPLGVHARILDFGLARMLGTGTASLSSGVTVGTPSYMSPEQCRGDSLDPRVDIYACGVMLFEMLAGKKPFVADNPMAIVKMHLEEEPPRLADVVSFDFGRLEDIVARALAKSPADRFPSAIAMADALEAAVAGRSAQESTAPLAVPVTSASDASIDIPIMVGTLMIAPVRGEETPSVEATPARADEAPRRAPRRPIAPAPRGRGIVAGLGVLLVAGAASAAWIYTQREDTTATPAAIAYGTDAAAIDAAADAALDPADELVSSASRLAASGQVDAALASLLKARRQHPDRASVPLLAGKLLFGKLWWSDGIASLRDAVRLDPSLRDDPDLQRTALRGFLVTPSYDDRLARFVLELGDVMAPLLDETARTHPIPAIRERAAALRRRLR